MLSPDLLQVLPTLLGGELAPNSRSAARCLTGERRTVPGRIPYRLRCRLPGLSGEFREPVDEELGNRGGIFQVGEVAGVDGLVGLRVVGRSEDKS